MFKDNRPLVLIVDDEEMVIASLRAFLRLETDFQVKGQTDPGQAVRFLQGSPVEVIVSDYLMPKMNGIQFLAQAKVIQPEATRVLLTAHGDKLSAIQGINEIGLYQYIEKPWDNAQFRLILQSGVERTQLLRGLLDKIAELDAAHAGLKNVQTRLLRAYL